MLRYWIRKINKILVGILSEALQLLAIDIQHDYFIHGKHWREIVDVPAYYESSRIFECIELNMIHFMKNDAYFRWDTLAFRPFRRTYRKFMKLPNSEMDKTLERIYHDWIDENDDPMIVLFMCIGIMEFFNKINLNPERYLSEDYLHSSAIE